MGASFEETLKRYAQVAVRVGLNLQPGQRLIVRAPIQAAPLVREVTAEAYQAGARLVIVEWNDDQVTLARYRYAPRDSFEEHPAFRDRFAEEHLREGGAFLSIFGTDPDLLKGQDPELIQTAQKTAMQHWAPASKYISRHSTNWCIVAYPVPAWAARVFPGLPPEEQVDRLWDAIVAVTRAGQEDPVAGWKRHIADLEWRSAYLNGRQYAALHFTGAGTDLVVGLPPGHRWKSAENRTESGCPFIANLPTEEVFTLPDRARVDGVVTASMPLNHAGVLVEGFSLEFKDGRVVSCRAEKGEETLRNLIATDEGAARLGEVALVPHHSPISDLGILFYSTLFDENAASHLALGRAYVTSLRGGDALSDEAFEAAGGNRSLVHVDFMVGAADTNIDGILADGRREPVMRAGDWAFAREG